jgi:catechol 2,3-dioxygenase-like lactoylglutathione lyase family enzyme
VIVRACVAPHAWVMLASMSLVFDQVTIEAADPKALGRWWSDALGWVVVFEDDVDVEIRPSNDGGVGLTPSLYFLPLPQKALEAARHRNRLLIDLRPEDQQLEVERLVAMGAKRVDLGDRVERYVVLTDPEGNEFTVLPPFGGEVK